MEQLESFLNLLGFSPKEVMVIIIFVVILIFFLRYLSRIRKDIDTSLSQIKTDLKADISTHAKSLISIEKAITEIQTALKINLKYDCKQEVVSAIRDMSQHNSPIQLKPEYRPFVEDSNIRDQVKAKENELLRWLRARKPKSGLEAQNAIVDLVVSGTIKDYIDRTEFDQKLYMAGKTILEANAILSLYLFEILIPQVVSQQESQKHITS